MYIKINFGYNQKIFLRNISTVPIKIVVNKVINKSYFLFLGKLGDGCQKWKTSHSWFC